MNSRSRLAATLVALAGAPAAPQGFQNWDTDGDRVLDESQLTQDFFDSGSFGEWDSDDDEAIGYSELSSGPHAA